MNIRFEKFDVVFYFFVVYWLVASIYAIEERDIWLDEGFTFLIVNSDYSVFWEQVLGDEINMLPYYLLVRPFALLGLDTTDLRYISLGPAFFSIVLLFWFCKRYFSSPLAILASFILVSNPLFIRYSGELRGYSLVMLLCLIGTIFLYQYLIYRKPTFIYLIALVAVTSFYAGILSLIYFGLIGIVVMLECFFKDKGNIAPFLGSCALTALALIPGLLVILRSDGENLDWISSPTLVDVYRILYQLLGGSHTDYVWIERVTVLGFIGVSAWIAISWIVSVTRKIKAPTSIEKEGIFFPRDIPEHVKAAVALMLGGGTLLIGFIVSMVQPIMVLRYFTMVIPAFTIVFAVGLYNLPGRVFQGSALALAVVAFSIQSAAFYDRDALKNQTDNWPGVTDFLAEETCSEDMGVVVLSPFEQVRFNAHIPSEKRGSAELACLSNLTPQWISSESGGMEAGVDVHKDIRSVKTIDWENVTDRYSGLWVIAVNRDISEKQYSASDVRYLINRNSHPNQYEMVKKVELDNTLMFLWERTER